jgi:hypothetical protein
MFFVCVLLNIFLAESFLLAQEKNKFFNFSKQVHFKRYDETAQAKVLQVLSLIWF